MRLFVIAIALICVVACKKDSGDTQKPVIVLNSPTGNQQFPAFSTVTISGTIADNDEIHEVHVEVINMNTSTEIVHVHDHVDAKSYNINQVFTAQAATTYKIHVEADDHVGNTTIVEIQVKGI
jgi:hypothetical protein